MKIKKHNIFYVLFVVFAVVTAIGVFHGYNTVTKKVPVAKAGADLVQDEMASSKNLVIGHTPIGAFQKDTVRPPVEIKGMYAKSFIRL